MDLEVINTTRFKPVGFCIYCGKIEEFPKKLTDEHIVPLALRGKLILPESSCNECNKITSSFEKKVLRGFIHKARIAGNFPTRHPENRPDSVDIQIERDNKFESASLPSNESIGVVMLLKMASPGFLAGRLLTDIVVNGVEVIGFGKPPEEIAAKLKTKTLRFSENVDHRAFARMLAKIGYSFAVGCLGVFPLEEVPVLPFILGKKDDGGLWIGSADYKLDLDDKKPQHSLSLLALSSKTENIIVSRVKLFAGSGATGYEVVVRRTKI